MEKAREFNVPLYMAFIDYRKAFRFGDTL
jgi:hypothetical protein